MSISSRSREAKAPMIAVGTSASSSVSVSRTEIVTTFRQDLEHGERLVVTAPDGERPVDRGARGPVVGDDRQTAARRAALDPPQGRHPLRAGRLHDVHAEPAARRPYQADRALPGRSGQGLQVPRALGTADAGPA